MSDQTPTTLKDAMRAAEATDITPAPGTEVERLLATGLRLLKAQQERLINEETNYQQRRLQVTERYRVSLEKISLEAQESLRSLDLDHRAKMAGIRELVAKLKAMREA